MYYFYWWFEAFYFLYYCRCTFDIHMFTCTAEPCGLPWHICYQIIKGICQGLKYLHERRIIHLDLKPDNVLLDDSMVPKIADFGLSRLLGKEKTHMITTEKIGTQLSIYFHERIIVNLQGSILSWPVELFNQRYYQSK